MRKNPFSWEKQIRLIEDFVSGATVRTATVLVGMNKSTAAYYFHRLREIIAEAIQNEIALAAKMKVILVASARGSVNAGPQEKCLSFRVLKRRDVYTIPNNSAQMEEGSCSF